MTMALSPASMAPCDLQVVLEVGTWHGMGQFQGLAVDGDDIERPQAFGNNPQGLGEVGVAPDDVRDRGYRRCGHMPDELPPMIRREHRRRVREPGGSARNTSRSTLVSRSTVIIHISPSDARRSRTLPVHRQGQLKHRLQARSIPRLAGLVAPRWLGARRACPARTSPG